MIGGDAGGSDQARARPGGTAPSQAVRRIQREELGRVERERIASEEREKARTGARPSPDHGAADDTGSKR